MKILAIETSCDETALALVEATGGLRAPKFKILKNLVASQIDAHRPFGGVVPMLAKREHIKNLPVVYRQILENKVSSTRHGKSALAPSSYLLAPDLLAVTVGPGLEPALWAGIEFAKSLYSQLKAHNSKLPLIGANHLEGHLYSFLLTANSSKLKAHDLFPAIALIVSGGHTILLKVDSLTKWKKLGETRDDAVGEAFDKVARILGLPYPGGPEIQRAAEQGDPTAINFPRPMLYSNSPAGEYDFSFSGLKTAVLYYVRDHPLKAHSSKLKANVAASFQQAAVDVLAAKTARAVKAFDAKSIFLSGGVAANAALRSRLSVVSRELEVNFLVPPITFNTDNATMIAVAAYIQHLQKKKNRFVANGTMTI